MTSPKRSSRALVIGLLLGLSLAVGLGHLLLARGQAGQAAEFADRAAIVSLQSVSEVVARLGLDSPALADAVRDFVSADPAVSSVRVIGFDGLRLAASTASADRGDAAAPRRLTRDEKPLYDLGQKLRAAVEANVAEGRTWKQEIEITRGTDGLLSLAGPVEKEGEVVGAVLLDSRPQPPPVARGALVPLLAVVLPVLALLVVGAVLAGRRALPAVLAALLLVAALGAYGRWAAGLLVAQRNTQETAMRTLVAEDGARFSTLVSALEPEAEATFDPERWDVDLYRQPRGFFAATAPERDQRLAAAASGLAARYLESLLPGGLLGLALMLYVGLGGARRTGATLVAHRRAYAYVLPAMAAMILLVFLPFFYGIALSFTNSNIYNTNESIPDIWVGLANFSEILTDFDLVRTTPEGTSVNYQNFYWTLGFTIIWTVSNVAIGVTVGLLLALILNARGLALRPIYRVLLILPWAMPNYITALIWRGMFHSQFGVINQVIQLLGGSAVSWYDTPFSAFITVLSTNGWLSFPFMMVISLGALQSIPADLYEAARVDGATRWQQFRTITLPSLKPALVPAIILSVVWTFNQFNVIYLVSGGEPGGSTEILITGAYKLAFEQYRYGYAAAYSVVIFLILLAYGIWQNRVTRATEGI